MLRYKLLAFFTSKISTTKQTTMGIKRTATEAGVKSTESKAKKTGKGQKAVAKKPVNVTLERLNESTYPEFDFNGKVMNCDTYGLRLPMFATAGLISLEPFGSKGKKTNKKGMKYRINVKPEEADAKILEAFDQYMEDTVRNLSLEEGSEFYGKNIVYKRLVEHSEEHNYTLNIDVTPRPFPTLHWFVDGKLWNKKKIPEEELKGSPIELNFVWNKIDVFTTDDGEEICMLSRRPVSINVLTKQKVKKDVDPTYLDYSYSAKSSSSAIVEKSSDAEEDEELEE